jgi:hypothetical protein
VAVQSPPASATIIQMPTVPGIMAKVLVNGSLSRACSAPVAS